jgi:site-specific recombinase XerD
MRQVIKRFLKHLDAEKNASLSTIESYRYDLHKFYAYLVNDYETDSCREMSRATTYHIILRGFQRSVIKSLTVPQHVRGRSRLSGHSSNTPIVQAY